MDRRHLEYFLAVAEAGSFTRAAERLTIAQPSLSQTVQLLERELGTTLFDRHGRGVRLTPAGEALVAPARRTLRSFSLAAGAVRGAAEDGSGRLTVITNTLWSMDPLARMVGAFRQVRPAVQVVVLDPVRRSDVLAALGSGDADLGLVAGLAPGGALRSQWVADQELVAVVPRAMPGLASPVAMADLAALGLVTTPRGTALRDYVEELLDRAGVSGEAATDGAIAVETPHLASIVPLVAAGAGVAVLPTGLAAEGSAAGVEHRTLDPASRTPVRLAWRDGALDETTEHFLEVARGMLGAELDPGDPPDPSDAVDPPETIIATEEHQA